jgi:hypothetical protein
MKIKRPKYKRIGFPQKKQSDNTGIKEIDDISETEFKKLCKKYK